MKPEIEDAITDIDAVRQALDVLCTNDQCKFVANLMFKLATSLAEDLRVLRKEMEVVR